MFDWIFGHFGAGNPYFPSSNISFQETKSSYLAYLERIPKSEAKAERLTPNPFCPSVCGVPTLLSGYFIGIPQFLLFMADFPEIILTNGAAAPSDGVRGG